MGREKSNKSQAVRLHATPIREPFKASSLSSRAGIKVSPTMVYYIKSKLGQAKRKARREKMAESSRKTGAANPVEIVLRVKDLAREVGGVKNLKQLVDLLAE